MQFTEVVSSQRINIQLCQAKEQLQMNVFHDFTEVRVQDQLILHKPAASQMTSSVTLQSPLPKMRSHPTVDSKYQAPIY